LPGRIRGAADFAEPVDGKRDAAASIDVAVATRIVADLVKVVDFEWGKYITRVEEIADGRRSQSLAPVVVYTVPIRLTQTPARCRVTEAIVVGLMRAYPVNADTR
jgi:hypothetical protein